VGLKTDIRLGPDFAYYAVELDVESGHVDVGSLFIHPNELFSQEIPKKYVVLSGTSSIYRSDRAPYSSEDAFRQLCISLQSAGYQPVLFAADKTDNKLLMRFAIEDNWPLVPASISTESAMKLLKGATAYISGRWHASILSTCVGTPPILGDANFFKTTALHKELNLPWEMFDFRNLSNDIPNIMEAIHFIEENPEIEDRLVLYAEEQVRVLGKIEKQLSKGLDIGLIKSRSSRMIAD
jgi:hypothetical protein